MEIDARTMPILASKDFEESITFYTALGFETGYYDPPDGDYLILHRGSIELHFFRFADLRPADNYCGAYIRSADADALYAQLGVEKIPSTGTFPRANPPEDKPWGMREFHILDPSGNLLRFGQSL